MDVIAERVARGSVWLDAHYPDWWTRVEISTLDVASCHLCVLGQVYTGCIPTAEQDQILAQVLSSFAGMELTTMRESVVSGVWGGYNTLYTHHNMGMSSADMGFSTGAFDWPDADGVMVGTIREMDMLTDEWTRVIISRRLAAHAAELEMVGA